ncbi:hypothetical protein M1349_03020 [Patescibacteria group bacterium]|nr:hypothetical protein [Patescibacteria group bacterium]
MPTIINNPPASESDGGGMGFLVGIVLLIIVVLLFFYYGLPIIRGTIGGGAPQINVPGKIDVNVNQNK